MHGIPQHFYCEISRNSVCSVLYIWSITKFPPLYRYFRLSFGHLLKRQKSIYCVYVQINLKAVLFGSSYKWGHVVSPTAYKKSQPRPPPQAHFRTTSGSASLTSRTTLPPIPSERETWIHLDVSGQQERVLVWTCLHHRGLSCTWRISAPQGLSCTCHVWTKGFCAGLDMSTPQGPELHLEDI